MQVTDTNVMYEGEKKFPALCKWIESLGAVKFGAEPKKIEVMEITSADQWTAEVAKKVSMTIIAMFDETGLQEARDGSSEAISILEQIAADNQTPLFDSLTWRKLAKDECWKSSIWKTILKST
eukprot:UN11246